MPINVVINGCPVELFDGASVGDAVLKFSGEVYKKVRNGAADVLDPEGNKYYLTGELSGGEVFHIEERPGPEKKMNKPGKIIIIAAVILFSLLLFGTLLTGNDTDTVRITIFHLNDLHGSIENMGKIANIVNSERERNPDTFLFQGGDNFSGNPVVDQYEPKGEPVLILMNKLKFDAGVIGNHDFDYGKKILKSFMNRAEFPVICANVKSSDPDFPQPEPYAVLKTKGGTEIVLLGLIQTEDHSGIPSTLPDNVRDLTFFRGIEYALNFRHLKKENNIFIALSHLGIEHDKILAEKMGELDLIIGGHSHTLIENPSAVNGVLIAQAGAHADFLGRIDILLKNGRIIERKGSMIDLKKTPASDPEIDELIKKFNSSSPLNKVLTTIAVPFSDRQSLGLMVTDAIREEMGLDMVFYNKGGIRISRLSGEVKARDIYAMHPFGNYIVEIRMTTEEIKELIKNDFIGHRGLDIIPSGLSYRVTRDLNRNVLGVELFDINGFPIPGGRTFRVGMNNYIVSSYKFSHTDPGRSTNVKTVDIVIRFFSGLKRKLDYSNIVRSEEKIVYSGKGEILGKAGTGIFVHRKKFFGNSPAGNLAADAMKAHTGADLAFFPTRLLRSGINIAEGAPVYREALPDIYSFLEQSAVVTVTVTGRELLDFLLERCRWKNNIDLQISGGTYSIFFGKNNAVSRVDLVLDDGNRPNPVKKYKIALIEYEFKNSYSLNSAAEASDPPGPGLENILSEYIRSAGTVPEKTREKRVELISGKRY